MAVADQNFDSVAIDGSGYSLGPTGAPRTIGDWTFTLLDATGVQSTDADSYVDVTNLAAQSALVSGPSDNVAYITGPDAYAAVLKSTSGEVFRFVSFRAESGVETAGDYRLIGYHDGVPITGAIYDFTAPFPGQILVSPTGAAWEMVDELRIVRQDGLADIALYIDDLDITTANKAPTITAPDSVTTSVFSATALTGISFGDPDAGSGTVTVTLSAPSGTLAATSGTGVTVGGTATALTLAGTLTDINAFIAAAGVTFTPPFSYSTSTLTLSVSIDDGGHDGSGGPQTASDTVAINVLGPPRVTDSNISISGATGPNGTYKIGDTVTGTWNNGADGDANAGVSQVSFNFSQFGGGNLVNATESAGIWTASYTIVGGGIDATNRNLWVNAHTDGGSTSSTGMTDATVDNIAPVVTDGNIAITGGTGTSGAFKIGDTVTATWNNTAFGDNNTDTLSSVTVDFSAFGGGSAVAASNASGTWTATYLITAGSIDATNRNIAVTVTDNADNRTTCADSTNATVDNTAPVMTDNNIAISGGTGTNGAFKIGDTVTATWNNTAGGDSNTDTISSVTVDFSAFGGGSATAASNSGGTWTATYLITAGSIDATNTNVAVTATDNAGNRTTRADSTNATVDNIAPVATAANITLSGGSGVAGAFVAGDTVTASWNSTADFTADAVSVLFDFTAFGGPSSVAATNQAGLWTTHYTLPPGKPYTTNLGVSVTVVDDAGLTTSASGTSNATVDTIVPTVSSVTAPTNGTYAKDAVLDFTVNFDEVVDIDTTGGTPRIGIDLDTGGRVYATYLSGSGTNTLVFRLVVATGQVDKTGIAVVGLETNGGHIADASGNAADPTLNSVSSTTGVLIDAPIPTGNDGDGGGGDGGDGDNGPVPTTPTGADVFVVAPAADGNPVTVTGTSGMDEVHIAGSVILGEGLENAVLTGLGDFTVRGNGLDNVIYGNLGNTTIFASGGNDFIDGGYGSNTVVFAGPASDFSVRITNGVAEVVTIATGDVTTIANVATLQFADGAQPLFATGQALVAGFYEAFLGRTLDADGFAFWMGESAKGLNPFDMLHQFANAPEFFARSSGLTPSAFVEWLYANFLDRAQDAPGQAYWTGAIENGLSYAEVAANFVFSDELGMRIDELLNRNDWLHIA